MELSKSVQRNSVYGIIGNQKDLDQTVNHLKSQNFRKSDISILMHPQYGTKAPEGATAGSATGAITGGIFGWLVGAGFLTIPGLGPFIAAGPIMSAIAGAGIGGTIGGITGGLIGLGIPEFEAQKYEGHIKNGGILITIHVDDTIWEMKAKEILEENGAVNIASNSKKNIDEVGPYFHTNADHDSESNLF
jgi:uncharacterized membrane protein